MPRSIGRETWRMIKHRSSISHNIRNPSRSWSACFYLSLLLVFVVVVVVSSQKREREKTPFYFFVILPEQIQNWKGPGPGNKLCLYYLRNLNNLFIFWDHHIEGGSRIEEERIERELLAFFLRWGWWNEGKKKKKEGRDEWRRMRLAFH